MSMACLSLRQFLCDARLLRRGDALLSDDGAFNVGYEDNDNETVKAKGQRKHENK